MSEAKVEQRHIDAADQHTRARENGGDSLAGAFARFEATLPQPDVALAGELGTLSVRTEILNVDTGERGASSVEVPLTLRDRLISALRGIGRAIPDERTASATQHSDETVEAVARAIEVHMGTHCQCDREFPDSEGIATAALSAIPAADDERAAIVAWLRDKVTGFRAAAKSQGKKPGILTLVYEKTADAIASGAHLAGDGR